MSAQTTTRIRTAAHTHPGHWRPINEDRFLVRELSAEAVLAAVADGMGGHAGGEIAAQSAVDSLAEFSPRPGADESQLVLAITAANDRVLDEASRRPGLQGMGCTLTVALVEKEKGQLSWGQVGDSRLYLLRAGELRQLTTDQNLAQSLVAAGQLTPAEARESPYRHMLNQCVGCRECVPASGRLPVEAGDLLLLSTDGLHGELSAGKIRDLLTAESDLERLARALVQAALARGGKDNVTVVLAAL